MQTGESQQYSFTISEDGALMGVGLLLATANNNTNVTWTFVGQNLPASESSTSALNPSATGGNLGPYAGAPTKFGSSLLLAGLPIVSSVTLIWLWD
jgi:hypothetical protein